MRNPPSAKAFFLEHGYLKLSDCFTAEQAADMTANVWTRLGMSADDRATWTRGRTNMPGHRVYDIATWAPRAWAAICELCGGEDRVAPRSREWRDSLIVNLGTAEREGRPVPPRDLHEWHVDGDFFVHYLDSPEQALLVTPLFTDIAPDGGGTMICPAAIPKIARWLYDNPAGVSPWMVPRADAAGFREEVKHAWYRGLARACADECESESESENGAFVEAVGKVGDVYLTHPFMLHSPTSNARRQVRIITNPPVSLRAPHCFDRPDGDYSLVEQKTIRSLGGEDKLKGWRITGPRDGFTPKRIRIQEAMRLEELRRLKEEEDEAQKQKQKGQGAQQQPAEVSAAAA
ncbi:hypothetical protein F4778DRAFT_782477 [Xylariomycetidae sp. FL2044]|nr:hypothetical protein F4778DRAFT_782477 [Xylariomycetidae sp. FL2044]